MEERPATLTTSPVRKSRFSTSPKKSPTKSSSRSPKKSPVRFFQRTSPKKTSPQVFLRQGSRNLSLTGRCIDTTNDNNDKTLQQVKPTDPCLPSGLKAFAKLRSVGECKDTKEIRNATQDIAIHFESTFHKSLLLISKRLERLDLLFRQYKNPTEDSAVGNFRELNHHLDQVVLHLHAVVKSFDRTARAPVTGMTPDTIPEGLSQAKYIITKLTPFYEKIAKSLRAARVKKLPVEVMFDGSHLTQADQQINEAMEVGRITESDHFNFSRQMIRF